MNQIPSHRATPFCQPREQLPESEHLNLAKQSLDEIRQSIECSDGEKKKFFMMIKRRWLERIVFASVTGPVENRNAFTALAVSLLPDVIQDAKLIGSADRDEFLDQATMLLAAVGEATKPNDIEAGR